MSSCLAIIGTAGRGDDAKVLTAAHWRMMTCIAQSVVTVLEVDHLVSGGSAWADAVAVQLYLDGVVKHLTLHLPTSFVDWGEGQWRFVATDTGSRLNQLHEGFQRATGVDPFKQLQAVVERSVGKGATVHVNPGGFKARNSDVAVQAHSLLAFTLSGSEVPDDGGTRDTWDKFAANALKHVRQEPQEDNATGGLYFPEPRRAYHFDLLNRQLYRHVYENPELLAEREKERAENEKWRAARLPVTVQPRTAEEERMGLL